MNIVHIGLACHYTEGMTYQDNIIPDINCKDGHTVSYISDVYHFENGKLIRGQEEDRILPSSLHLIRLDYDKVISDRVSIKIIKCNRLRDILEKLQPEVILYHGLGGYALTTVAEYTNRHPNITFYADSHANFNNSSKTFLSKLFNKCIHGIFIKKALPYISKVFYLSIAEKYYLQKMYHIDEDKLECLPLGGTVFELGEKRICKERLLRQLELPKECILYGHSGKLEKEKKTAELIRAFTSIDDERQYLIIFGSIPETNKEIISLVNSNPRIIFLGWQNGKKLFELLLAIDMYCQPGTCSATFQNAICCGCAVMAYPYKIYEDLINNNGYFVKTEKDMREIFLEISKNPKILESMKEKSHNLAIDCLDYVKIAARLYQIVSKNI